MYGMIHRAIRQMVIDEAGPERWASIERRHGVGPQDMISAHVYEDALTVALLQSAADELGMALPDCLRAFGHYWIRFAERGSYGALMDFTGRDLPSFIANLDRMHQAVQAAMPAARVPSFTLAEARPDRIRVEYRSEREGLEPFVEGLLAALVERFGQRGTVTLEPGQSNAVEFLIALDAG